MFKFQEFDRDSSVVFMTYHDRRIEVILYHFLNGKAVGDVVQPVFDVFRTDENRLKSFEKEKKNCGNERGAVEFQKSQI